MAMSPGPKPPVKPLPGAAAQQARIQEIIVNMLRRGLELPPTVTYTDPHLIGGRFRAGNESMYDELETMRQRLQNKEDKSFAKIRGSEAQHRSDLDASFAAARRELVHLIQPIDFVFQNNYNAMLAGGDFDRDALRAEFENRQANIKDVFDRLKIEIGYDLANDNEKKSATRCS